MELNDRMPLRYRGITWLMALLGFAVMVISIWGCAAGQRPLESGKASAAGQEGKDDRILVVTTIFPYYDFVRQIAGDRVKLKLVVPAGMDSHSFEPTPADMIAMQEADQGRLHMIVVADKFPFRYFADEYGLSYRAAFSGCSGDTEPSARTIAYLIDKVKEDRIPAVYYLELSSHRTAEIIQEETGAMPLLLHSCHNVTRKQFDEGVTYLQLMKQNVENLRYGLE